MNGNNLNMNTNTNAILEEVACGVVDGGSKSKSELW